MSSLARARGSSRSSLKIGLVEMDTAEVARRDQVVDMHIPQRAAILPLMLAEQSLELTQASHLGAVETEPARYLCEITAAVGRVRRIDAMRSELMCALAG